MIEAAKLLRVLSLIRLLNQRPGYTVAQLAQLLDCDRRTIYRYLELLEAVGYLIDEDSQGRKFIFEARSEWHPSFSTRETALLRQALATVNVDGPLRESLYRKLYLTSELVPLADELLDIHRARMIERLSEALRKGQRVRLVRYQSTNSGTIRDRDVEPLGFSEDFTILNAVEVEAGKTRTFKTRRIADVQVLAEPCVLSQPDEVLDAFGMAGTDWKPIELRLTARAYRLLTEEYPAARAFLFPQPDSAELPYQFRGLVRDYTGIGRFVLGLPTEVNVVSPADFRDFLHVKTTHARW
jgi:predicted DNA-binding transcriptional regulator YafY